MTVSPVTTKHEKRLYANPPLQWVTVLFKGGHIEGDLSVIAILQHLRPGKPHACLRNP